jgi:hypothetical protein
MNALRVAVAGWLLSVAGMKRVLAAAALGVLVAVAGPAAAQPGVDFSTTTSPSERLELRSIEKTRPGEAGYDGGQPGVYHRPVFIGPTLRSETSEFGLSAWIAPETPVGGPRAGGGEVSGWASFGLTFTWDGPPQRPSSGPVVR